MKTTNLNHFVAFVEVEKKMKSNSTDLPKAKRKQVWFKNRSSKQPFKINLPFKRHN